MPISAPDLARAKSTSVEQVGLLRATRGATNDTLEGLPEAALRRAVRRIDYPDLPRARAEFRFLQETDDGGQVPPNALATAAQQRVLMLATSARRTAAGVPVAPTGPSPG